MTDKKTYKTVDDAFSDLPQPDTEHTIDSHTEPRQQDSTTERMREADWGETLFDSWNERVRLHPHRPAPTLKAGQRHSYHFGHPYTPRKLTIRERARLQTFPDSYQFSCGVVAARTLTGNAVPVDLAEAIVDELP